MTPDLDASGGSHRFGETTKFAVSIPSKPLASPWTGLYDSRFYRPSVSSKGKMRSKGSTLPIVGKTLRRAHS